MRHSLPARFADFRRGFKPRTIEPAWRLILHKRLGAPEGCPVYVNSSRSRQLDQTMALSPFKFLQEVRTETSKVTWPTRRETLITTIMVFVLVILSAIFFFVSDQVIRMVITFILGVR